MASVSCSLLLVALALGCAAAASGPVGYGGPAGYAGPAAGPAGYARPAAGAAASSSAQAGGPAPGRVDCSTITGCASCVPFSYDLREAAARFASQQAAKAQLKAQRAAAAAARAAAAVPAGAQGVPVAAPGGPAAAPAGGAARAGAGAGVAAPGRGLRSANELDAVVAAAEMLDGADQFEAYATGATGAAAQQQLMGVAPSCVACAEGYALVAKSVRGRPAMGRCECAAGYGVTYGTLTTVNKRGETKLRKTFTCTACGPNQVPLTPAAGVKVTNSGLLLLQEPLTPAAEGQAVPRPLWFPGAAQKRFSMVPGQCVDCPIGSIKSADGMTCELDM
ncbi:hypothetical protein HT031_005586 [Scenedesmus sp. PABB004]|nr:hypothetical protein HT031_005586 [Scenedesmus sp. PABB004]